MSKEQFLFRHSILLIYALNVFFILTLAVVSIIVRGESTFKEIFIVLITSIVPALGAYGISCLSNWCKKTVLTVFLNCVQIFLLGLISHIHFYFLSTFGFVSYARQIMSFAPSLLVPWVFYAICGLGVSFAFFGLFYGFKKIILLRKRKCAAWTHGKDD